MGQKEKNFHNLMSGWAESFKNSIALNQIGIWKNYLPKPFYIIKEWSSFHFYRIVFYFITAAGRPINK